MLREWTPTNEPTGSNLLLLVGRCRGSNAVQLGLRSQGVAVVVRLAKVSLKPEAKPAVHTWVLSVATIIAMVAAALLFCTSMASLK